MVGWALAWPTRAAERGWPRPHVEAQVPGELLCLDTFYLGKLRGVGKVWQITACDAACSYGVARLRPGAHNIDEVHRRAPANARASLTPEAIVSIWSSVISG